MQNGSLCLIMSGRGTGVTARFDVMTPIWAPLLRCNEVLLFLL